MTTPGFTFRMPATQAPTGFHLVQRNEAVSDDIILDIQNVTKRFPGVTALDNVSIQIRRGEIHGFVRRKRRGEIDADENPVRRISLWDLRRQHHL